jgi:hypothetical protein
MKQMPKGIKDKLRRLYNLKEKAQDLEFILSADFQKYGIDINDLSAMGKGDVQTEAYTFITYAEGDVEESINMIEKVFLHYANNKEITE